jgi:hypothetical protein
VIKLERKTIILIASSLLVLAALSGIAVFAYANAVNGTGSDTTTTTNIATCYGDFWGGARGFFGRRGFGWGFEWGPMGNLTVSQTFINNAVNIAKSNSSVQTLLSEGYNITNVRPIISTSVGANGTVTMQATTAVITLTQSSETTTGRALVWVNMQQDKVTKIVIMTRTVIQ